MWLSGNRNFAEQVIVKYMDRQGNFTFLVKGDFDSVTGKKEIVSPKRWLSSENRNFIEQVTVKSVDREDTLIRLPGRNIVSNQSSYIHVHREQWNRVC